MTDSVIRFLKRHRFSCLGVVVFAACAGFVFFPVLTRYAGLLSPDAMPFFSYANRTLTFENLLTGGAFTPHTLYWLLFNPLYAHELTYIIDSLVLALAGVYYLAGRRVHPLAAWAGGLALGLSGYTFTLFSAGHRGYFYMFSCAIWSFGLLIRCFETRKLFYFAMLGLVFAWGVPYQPDVLILVGAVAAAYALWLTIRHRSQESGVRSQKKKHSTLWDNVVSVWPRFFVSVLVLVLAGYGGLRSAVTTQIATRDAQIAGVSVQEAEAIKKPAKLSDAEKHTRWLFATNWSLPPEDMLEFIAPGVFGNESMQMPYPYWGRLGRPSDEVFQKGRMMPNYRGHTVYLGIIPVLFALFGVFVWFSSRKQIPARLGGLAVEKPIAACRWPVADCRLPTADYSDVPFWCGVWIVCLILAMGRYTPFYRLFYAIPYMDYIRAPVKLHHLTEVATAFLAGFGIDAFMRVSNGASVRRRKLAGLAGGVAVALFLGAGLMLANKPDIVKHITSLGMGQVASTLGGYAVQNLTRSACLAALVAGLAIVSAKWSERALMRTGYVLMVMLALDQACVARRYVRVINVEPFYHENAVVKALKKAANGQIVNVVNYVTPNAVGQDWFTSSLVWNGIRNLALTADEQETPYGKLFMALQNAPARLWQLLNVQYVIVPRKECESLLRAGILSPVLDFELGAGIVRHVAPGDKSLMLARVSKTTQGPRWVADWRGGVPVDKQVETAVSEKSFVSDAPSAMRESGAIEAGALRVLSSRGTPGALNTCIKVTAKVPGLLIFDERLTDKQEVLVDNNPATLHVVDGIWPAAVIPSGEHTVVLRHKRACAIPLVSGTTALAVLMWWLAAKCIARRPKRDTGCPA